MSTTSSNFAKLAAVVGGTATGVVIAATPQQVSILNSASGVVVLDVFAADLSKSGYAKNGAFVLALAASTPVTVDLTATGTASTAAAGDTSFAHAFELIFNNYGAADVLVGPGASNPFNGPLLGTAPTFTVPAGATVRWQCPAGWTVDSTHKTLKFDPGAAVATIGVSIGGS